MFTCAQWTSSTLHTCLFAVLAQADNDTASLHTYTCTLEVEEECEEAVGILNGVVYVVTVKTDVEIMVSNLMQQISEACSLFLRWSNTIVCEVTGSRRASADRPRGGLKAFVRCSTRGKS